MKSNQRVLIPVLLLLAAGAIAAPVGTAFNYQGTLSSGGNAANGSYDLKFSLYNAASGPTQVGVALTNAATILSNGYFTVSLDFGSMFDGDGRWLEIGVRTNGGGDFTTLSPRQQLTPSPYALYTPSAGTAATAATADSVAAANVTGTLALAQMPAAVVTDGASGVVLSGTFSGNGAGLTTLPPFVLTNNQTGVTLGDLSVSNLHLPALSGEAGVIYAGGDSLIQGPGLGNFFVGPGAGNPYMSGMDNLGVGTYALRENASGNYNMGVGYYALAQNTVGWFNTANGIQALGNNTNGFQNTAHGFGALYVNTSGSANTAVGYSALTLSTGSGNIALGYNAGSSLTNGDNNIAIGNVGGGDDHNTIRLGTPGTHLNTFIAGVINGDGAGLTNLPAVAVATPPPGMVLIPAGTFTMGNSIGDGDITDATPISTTVSAFYMDVNEVSWSQWQSVYFWATNHGYGFVHAGAGKGANHPVQMVNWYDCAKWCNARSQQAGRTPVYYTDAGLTQVYTNSEVTVYANWSANSYRLPTEAEWEKAARGGLSGQRFPWGNVINQNLANYYGNTASATYDLGPSGLNPIGSIGGTSPATSPVGSFAANGYGLNDMPGNIMEWCWDWYGTPYAGGSDPRGPASGSNRVFRGGDWGSGAQLCRSAHRFSYFYPNYASREIGFRSVLPSGQ